MEPKELFLPSFHAMWLQLGYSLRFTLTCLWVSQPQTLPSLELLPPMCCAFPGVHRRVRLDLVVLVPLAQQAMQPWPRGAAHGQEAQHRTAQHGTSGAPAHGHDHGALRTRSAVNHPMA